MKSSSSQQTILPIICSKWINSFANFSKSVYYINLLIGPLSKFPHSMEPQLRQLGLPTELKKGKSVWPLAEYYISSLASDIEQVTSESLHFISLALRCIGSREGNRNWGKGCGPHTSKQ